MSHVPLLFYIRTGQSFVLSEVVQIHVNIIKSCSEARGFELMM